jgi:hypothetical protein
VPEQRSEDVVGPFELQDFILYYALRFGDAVEDRVPGVERMARRVGRSLAGHPGGRAPPVGHRREQALARRLHSALLREGAVASVAVFPATMFALYQSLKGHLMIYEKLVGRANPLQNCEVIVAHSRFHQLENEHEQNR